MSDLFGNHIVGFPTRRLKSFLLITIPGGSTSVFEDWEPIQLQRKITHYIEPSRGKTNNVVSDQV